MRTSLNHATMMQLLISVTSLEEAQIALENGADFIDLKDPSQGALGALPLETITEIVSYVHAAGISNRKLTSATIGDLPMQPQLIAAHVERLAVTGVDMIKIGFFDDGENKPDAYEQCLSALQSLASNSFKLVAVLFAEHEYPCNLISHIKNAGFYGVMLDTATKNGATFFDYFTADEISKLSKSASAHDLMFGLAGSLNIQHIEKIKQLDANYVGFRGGVCVSNQRKFKLDSAKIRAISKLL